MKHLTANAISMESINDIIDTQTFNRQLVDETSDLISAGSGNVVGVGEPHTHMVHSPTAVFLKRSPVHEVIVGGGDHHTLISAHAADEDDLDDVAGSVVMVIGGGGGSSPVQTTYQIMPQQMQLHNGQLSTSTSHADRLCTVGSPVDFVGTGTDVLIDGSSSNSRQVVAIKQEHGKFVIVNQHQQQSHRTNNNSININHNSNHNSDKRSNHNNHTLDLGSGVSVMDDLSSDAVEVTLNQHHHQQLIQQQQQQHHQHQQQYGHLTTATDMSRHHHHNQSRLQQQQSSHQQQQQRSHQHHFGVHHNQNSNNHESHVVESLSVIVQQHDNDDVDDDDDDSRDDDSRGSTGQLLSPALGGVGVVGDNSLEHTTYQTLTSVNERMSPPVFSYATLTPIQPLPPISTMSDKFTAYGHATVPSGSNTSGSSVGSNGADCGGPFAGMPHHHHHHHQNSLGALSLSGLSGVQSPYSSYDKLPSMLSPSPHNYAASSPSHTLSGMVVSCDLHSSTTVHSPGLSSHSELHSPTLSSGCKSLDVMQSVTTQKSNQISCLSPPLGVTETGVAYETSYSSGRDDVNDHHDLLVVTTSTHSNASATATAALVASSGRNSQLRLQHSPILSPQSASAVSLHSPISAVNLPNINSTIATSTLAANSLAAATVELSSIQSDTVVVSLTPSPPPQSINNSVDDMGTIVSDCILVAGDNNGSATHLEQQQHNPRKSLSISNDCNPNNGLHLVANIGSSNSLSMCNINQMQQEQQQHHHELTQHVVQHQHHPQQQQQQQKMQLNASNGSGTTPSTGRNSNSGNSTTGGSGDMEEINTKELAQRISAELKRYSIPQAIFAQRVLCRSQGTLSDLLRNPKPWSKLKSGRETFRRMFKWLQEPEFQRMSALRLAAAQIPQRSNGPSNVNVNNVGTGTSIGSSVTVVSSNSGNVGVTNVCVPGLQGTIGSNVNNSSSSNNGSIGSIVSNCRRKDEPHMEHMSQPKKPRLVFTDLQRRTLQAIFKETKRPSKEMQVTIARQLGLEPTTVGNFFMNARRRSMDKWRDDDGSGGGKHGNLSSCPLGGGGGGASGVGNHHMTAMSPLDHHQHSLDFEEHEHDDMDDLDLEHNDFDLVDGDHDHDMDNDNDM